MGGRAVAPSLILSMDSQKQHGRSVLYPQVIESNPEPSASPFFSNNNNNNNTHSSIYPNCLDDDDDDEYHPCSCNSMSMEMAVEEEVLLSIPGAILHLIDHQKSVHLASGDLSVVRLRQGDNVVAVLARIQDQIQWPLAKDEPTVKLDHSHYFFTLTTTSHDHEQDHVLNYGLTIPAAAADQDQDQDQNFELVKELDDILQLYTCFSIHKVEVVTEEEIENVLSVDARSERSAEAYWTTLAPNVEDYGGSVARAIAAGSTHLIKAILWCGDVTVHRLKWGDQFLRNRVNPCAKESEVSPAALRRIKRVKRISKMSDSLANGLLSGVLKLSAFFTTSIANSKAANNFFSLLPGEIVLASLDGFSKVCDAFEVSGKNVMSTTSVVTTGLVSHRYGEKAGEATSHGLDAAGHAIGTAWAVFKIRKALNPKSAIKPTSLTKAAIADARSKQRK
ncbi:hypothetical protein Scep_020783 [Stephania cephalantha]|uniref:Senescence domain-containing protein n=1 Tax=Stephania cephalantha TaxID=152367 RepID=A0AAP0ID62_9MAGN